KTLWIVALCGTILQARPPVENRDQFETINTKQHRTPWSGIDQKARQTSRIDYPTKSAKPPPPVQILAMMPWTLVQETFVTSSSIRPTRGCWWRITETCRELSRS